MRKKTAKNLALALTGAAVLAAAPAALAQAAIAPSAAGSTVSAVPNGSPAPDVQFQSASYPAFADDRPQAAAQVMDASSAIDLGDALRDASAADAYPVASGDLQASRLDDLLASRLDALGGGQAYISGDAGAYAKRLFDANGGLFSVAGERPQVARQASAGALAYAISGSFTLTNTRSVANPLKDGDGNVLVPSVPAGGSVTYAFSSSAIPGIRAQAAPGGDAAVTVDWVVPELYVSLSGAGTAPTRIVLKNVQMSDGSGVNLTIRGAIPGMDPYAAKAGLVGAGKKFSASLITPKRVAADASRTFTDAFATAKSGAAMLAALLGDAVARRGTDYSVADLVADNASQIADFALAAVPALGQAETPGAPPVSDLIKAILGSYSKNATRQTVFDAVYQYRDTIVSLIAQSLSAFPSYAQAAKAFLADVSSGDQLFLKISQLSSQIRGFLGGTGAEPLLNLVTALSSSKDTYALDLLTDKDVAGPLLDLFLSAPAGDVAPSLTKLVSSYRSFFLDLLTSAKNPVDAFVKGMFGDGAKMFKDMLGLLSANLDQAAPQISSLLDAFVFQNPTFADDGKLLDAAYALFDQTAKLFAPGNLAKITLSPLQSDPSYGMTVENSADGKDVIVKGLNVGYSVNASGFTVSNGFVDALLGFFPTEPLAQTVDRFVQPEMDNARAQAQTAIQAELSKLWYAFILPGDAAHNIAYGPSWDPSSGVVDLIVALTKQGMAPGATLQALAREILFGTATADQAAGFADRPFAVLNGSITVNYSGYGLYALPYYGRDLLGNTVMDYQIMGAELDIDPTSLAENSKFFVSSSDLTGSDTPVISAFGLSQALQKGVRQLLLGFVDHTVDRPYGYKTRLVLSPDQADSGAFVLDQSDPAQRVAIGAAVPGYSASVAAAWSGAQQADTVAKQLSPGWTYFHNQPALTDAAQAALDGSISMSDALGAAYGKYAVASDALYGSGESELKATFSAKVFVGTIFNIWQWVNAELTFSYDIRLADRTLYLPWPVQLTDANGNKSLGDTLKLSLTDFRFGYTTLWWL